MTSHDIFLHVMSTWHIACATSCRIVSIAVPNLECSTYVYISRPDSHFNKPKAHFNISPIAILHLQQVMGPVLRGWFIVYHRIQARAGVVSSPCTLWGCPSSRVASSLSPSRRIRVFKSSVRGRKTYDPSVFGVVQDDKNRISVRFRLQNFKVGRNSCSSGETWCRIWCFGAIFGISVFYTEGPGVPKPPVLACGARLRTVTPPRYTPPGILFTSLLA